MNPQQLAVAAAQAALAAKAPGHAQGFVDGGLKVGAFTRIGVQLGTVQRRQFWHGITRQSGHRAVGPLDARTAHVGNANVRQTEHQFALTQHVFQLGLLCFKTRDVGQNGHCFRPCRGAVTRAFGASHRQRIPTRLIGFSVVPKGLQLDLVLARGSQRLLHRVQQRIGRKTPPEGLAQGGASGLSGRKTHHSLKAQVAAHQHVAAQIGNACCGAVQDGAQLTQQLLVALTRRLLFTDVQRDDRQGASAITQPRGFNTGQQPASS